MSSEIEHLHYTYNDIHKLIAKSAVKIAEEFKPDMFIAIGEFFIYSFDLHIYTMDGFV